MRPEEWSQALAELARRTRPDRAEALTRAAEYDRWVRAKVLASRDDPRPAVADDEWRRIRAAKLAERQAVQEAYVALSGATSPTRMPRRSRCDQGLDRPG